MKQLTRKILFALCFATAFTPATAQKTNWGHIDYKGNPWVRNVSTPNKITQGLYKRHLSLCASHGRYYDEKNGRWEWQRPYLFCTTEDLYTQTIVVPYLIPMLEKAGAVVFTPRERDWQKNEIIVDNDDANRAYYREAIVKNTWTTTMQKGFARHADSYRHGENPFEAGTARMAKTVKSKNPSTVSYQPNFSEEGRYAVYVSYQTVNHSISDAEYIVYHKGTSTSFKVNQQMGGSTWVYLGTFDFDKGCNAYNRVVVTNNSKQKGVVTTDAVRFGGGMGNIVRGGTTSGLPRCLEAARYYAQWAGAPESVYGSRKDDYRDDIITRPMMANWLAGGSVYVPETEGKHVPIELSLAIHSDAGFRKDLTSKIGTLSIATTDFNNGIFGSGLSRQASVRLADMLLNGVHNDLTLKYGEWVKRAVWDKNYGETRVPEVPSSILEILSHQSFPDMKMGQDPNFKFTLARSIYKTILRFVASQHGTSCVVQPLAPENFAVQFVGKNKVRLSWTPVSDPQEPTARPTAYNVYTATGTGGFDNGQRVKGTSVTLKIEPGTLHSFRVTAVNEGGESFPTETLAAYSQPEATKTVLIVNGFHRLSSPAVIDNSYQQGFDLNEDPGITYGLTAGWSGAQQNFDTSKIGIESPEGLGYSGSELCGQFIAGNDFNYTVTHAQAIAATRRYNIVSCSSHALERGFVGTKGIACIDLLLGLERNDGHSLVPYKALPTNLQDKLAAFALGRGRLIVSGAYLASDATSPTDIEFLQNILKTETNGTYKTSLSPVITGMGTSFDIYNQLNACHYAVTSADILAPVGTAAFPALLYGNGTAAAIAYPGSDYKSFVMGFPFECIKDEQARNKIMAAILNFVNS
ncbi:MAG: fibronectin type III domain-containing protein [Prevotella sp.]|nr:fibronectin type III domain-containing protein [Prevotella sp.]